jgi:hypothetical protein
MLNVQSRPIFFPNQIKLVDETYDCDVIFLLFELIFIFFLFILFRVPCKNR